MNPLYKTVGILGGMGPYATLSFFEKILKLTPAKKDWDHLHLIIDNNPHIPSRSRYYLYGESSPVQKMMESCKRLQAYPVDFIVIPCNSASIFIQEIQAQINIPILNIIEITVKALTKKFSSPCSVAVFGGVITYGNRTYEPFLKKSGFAYYHHSSVIQKNVEKLIEKIKLNSPRDEIESDFSILISHFHQEHQVDAVILGCTEFGLISNKYDIPLIDSNHELALYTVEAALA
jgi:aspartate racemase